MSSLRCAGSPCALRALRPHLSASTRDSQVGAGAADRLSLASRTASTELKTASEIAPHAEARPRFQCLV
eukprot:3513921-Amphidinium_carterae.1